MATRKNKITAPDLKTEGPLSEKDEQGIAMEQARKLGQAALEKWRHLKAGIVSKFKRS